MSSSIDLFGWDTTFAITYSQLNKVIEKQKTTPTSFSKERVNAKGATVGKIEGNWSDWSITTNGDGKNITMKCPITNGNYYDAYNDENNPLDNTWIIIELKLFFDKQDKFAFNDATAEENIGTPYNLIVSSNSSSPEDPVISIQSHNFDFSKSSSDPDTAESICIGLFNDWFTEHISDFRQIFAYFILNAKASQGDFQWLKPTKMEYATSSTDELNTSVFGVLCMTQGRPIGIDTHSIDARIFNEASKGLPEGSPKIESVFSISGERFTDKWLLPGCIAVHLGTSFDDYIVAHNGLSYENKNTINCTGLIDSKGNEVTASVEPGHFVVSLFQDCIKMQFDDLTWDDGCGITVHVDYSEQYKIALKSGTDSNGKEYKNVLTVEADGKPTLNVNFERSTFRKWFDIGIEIAFSIIGAMVGAAAGSFLEGFIKDGAQTAAKTAEELAIQECSEIAVMDLSETLGEAIEATSAETLAAVEKSAIETAAEDIIAAATMEAEGATGTDILAAIAGKCRNIGTYFKTNKWKIAGSIIGAGIGASIGMLPKILEAINEDRFSELPTMDTIAANAVGAIKWPESSGFELKTANLAGALLLGGTLIEENSNE
ncbi:TULIP family P47-like protein [Ruminococcus albus]|uniref:p-47 protein n=1 Tax=Ruminococcus albus TaxID=1264 RepID=A0A1I1R4V4_RUMAL|nr:TULIP family P47-like protein [Ruminococcus albus]SFD29411.1 P-47 protein [Ruminococcus albus]